MRLTVLGSSGTWPTPGRPASGYLISHEGTRVWVDAGPGTFMALGDGSTVYTIEGERSARFLPAFGTGIDGVAPQDVDGCEGTEMVALRQGALSAAGTRPTRVHIYDAEARIVWRSEPYTTAAHALAVANLDGEGPFELVELRADGDADAKIYVHRAAQ